MRNFLPSKVVKSNWSKYWLVLIFCTLFFSTMSFAQYTAVSSTDAGFPGGLVTDAPATTTGWTLVVPGSAATNEWSDTISIPFNFDFYGNPVTHFKVSSNGLLTFDTTVNGSAPGNNTSLPSASIPNLAIASYWDDFTTSPPVGSNDAVWVKTFGTAPNRQFMVKWFSHEWNTLSFAYVGIILEESTNLVYTLDLYGVSAGGSTTIGVQENSTSATLAAFDVPFAGNGSGIPDIDYYTFYPPGFCINPGNLVTSNIGTTTATGSWDSNGAGVSYELEIGLVGFTPGTGSLVSTSDTFVNATGLSPASTYDWYVRKICGASVGDTSLWVGPATFSTLCVPFTAPYSQDFDIPVEPDMPVCWTIHNNTTSSSSFVGTENFENFSAPQSLELYNGTTTPGDLMAVSPEFSDFDNTKRIKFQMWDDDGTSDLVIGTLSDPNNPATFTPYDTILAGDIPDDTWTPVVVNFDNYSGTDLHFAFQHGMNNSFDNIYIDDVVYENIPSCLEPSNLNTVNIGSTTATGIWSSNGPGANFILEIGAPGFMLGTGTQVTATDTFYNATGLSPFTDYEWYVREVCVSGVDTSAWSGPNAFKTTLSPLSNPSACLEGIALPDDNDPAFLAIPINVTTTVGTQLGTDVILTDVNMILLHTYRDDVELKLRSPNGVVVDLVLDEGLSGDNFGDTVGTGGSCDSVFNFNMNASNFVTAFTTSSPAVGSWVPEGDFASFEDGSDPNGVWTLEYTDDAGGDVGTLEFVELVFSAPPSCPNPTALTVDSAASTSIDLSWINGGTETAWVIEYDTAGFVQGTGNTVAVSSNPYTLTGLSPTTQYDIYIRSICSPGDSSIWEGPTTATTIPIPAQGITCSTGNPTVVFTEEFDNNSQGWTGNIGSANGDWEIPGNATSGSTGPDASNAHSGGTNSFMNYEASATTANSGSAISPAIDLTTGIGSAELSFWLYAYGASIGTMDVGVGTSPTGPFTTVFTWSGPYHTAGNQPWLNVGVDLSAYVGQTIYLEFFNTDGTGGTGFDGDIAIDLVEVTTCVACAPPTNLNTLNITPTSATGVWTTTGSGNNFELEIGPAGFMPGTGTVVNPTDTFYNATGLTAATCYDWYLREICGPGDTSSWVGPVGFCTPCNISPYTLPFIEGFEASTGTLLGGGVINCSPAYGLDLITTDPEGRARYGTDAVIAASGAGAITLDRDPSGGVTINYLDFTIDLASYAANTDIELLFDYAHHGEESHPNDRVWIRGSLSDPWVEIYDTYANRPTTGQFGSVGPLDVDATLSGAGQTISSTFQVRFGQEDNFPATSPTISDGFTFDNVVIRQTPTCVQPDMLAMDTVLPTSATGVWNSNGPGTQFQVEYGPAGFVPGSGTIAFVTDTFINVTGLTPETCYDWFVREICTPGDSSFWSGPLTFCTPCQPAPFDLSLMAYFENFDALSTPDIPCDWIVYNENNDADFWQTNSSISASAPNSMWISWDGTNVMNDWVFTNELIMDASESYEVTFTYGNSSSTWTEKMALYIANGPTINDTISRLWEDTAINSGSLNQLANVTLSIPSNGNYRLAFYGFSDANQINLAFDDLEVRTILSNDLEVIDITGVSSGCELGSQSVDVTVVNKGTSAANSFDVDYLLNGTPTAGTSVSTPLPAFDTTIVTISGINVPNYQTYDLQAYAVLVGDGDNFNDSSAVVSFENFENPTVTTDTSIVLCAPQNVTLIASANFGNLIWTDGSGNVLATGDSLDLGVVSANQTVNVEAVTTSSDSITAVPFTGTNGCGGGSMFDVIPTNPIAVDSMWISLGAAAGTTVEVGVWYRLGTFVGNETDPAAWTFLDSVTVTAAGALVPTSLPLTMPLPLMAGQTYGMYINADVDYATLTAPVTYSDANVQLVVGTGLCSHFGGTNANRGWNGVLWYTAAGCSSGLTSVDVSIGSAPGTVAFTESQQAGTLTMDFVETVVPTADSLNWDFGDGNTGTGSNPSHTYATDGSYSVCLTAYLDGCDTTVCQGIFVAPEDTIGINPALSSSVALYPNPTEGSIVITTSGKSFDGVEILDMLGNVVYRDDSAIINEKSMELGHLESGSYLIRLTNKDGIAIKRLVLSK